MPEFKWNKDLKSPHLEIATSEARKIGVLAGPGTGKTSYGLMRRIMRLLEYGLKGEKILLLSFTRTAASDLKAKIDNLGVAGADKIRATTLHSYCFGLLQKDFVLKLTGRTPRTLLNYERDLMLRDLDGEFGNIHERRKQLKAYEAGWARNYNEYPGDAVKQEDKDFQSQVLSWLKQHKAIMIGEVVPLAYKYLLNNPEAEEFGSFSHILVDEYQDLNAVEQKLIDILSGSDEVSVCTVGDDDQSIYGFRFANPRGILEFVGREDVEQHIISKSGRSPEPILSMANVLISHAPDRKKPPMECGNTTDGIVEVIQWNHLKTEIDGIVAAIAHDIVTERRMPGDILVLCPRQYIGEKIRQGLQDQKIPVASYFDEEELKSDKAKESMALLNLLTDSADLVSWRVLLGNGDANGRSDTYKKLYQMSYQTGKTAIEILDEMTKGHSELQIHSLMRIYIETTKKLNLFRELSLTALNDRLFPEGDKELTEIRILALEALNKSKDVSEFYQNLFSRITQPEVPQHPTFVRIMSLHKSKGLTSPCVYVLGAIDGLIPFIKGELSEKEKDDLHQEQRRLLYVAITRSSQQLVISSSTTMGKEAYAMGIGNKVKVLKKDKDGELIVKTIAMPFFSEFGKVLPQAIKGKDWIEKYVSNDIAKH